MAPSTDMSRFHQTLHKSKHIICVAGAGLSAASGVPTFRGAGGLWRSYNALDLATPQSFAKDPSRVWQFYHMRREKACSCPPNPAQMALAKLFVPDLLSTLSPGATFTLITQNVDGLSLRALRDLTANPQLECPPNLIEMHGRLFDTICTACGEERENLDSPIAPALAGTEGIVEAQEDEPDIPLELLPRCGQCGGLLRPGVVWFGEVPKRLEEIDVLAKEADLCLVVGTSAIVYPAAGIADTVRQEGGKVAVFNLEGTPADKRANFRFLGPCEETLPKALFGGLEPEMMLQEG
ncbi:DHS-like NAD/FAD-binding domain-containing protein [Calocera cornea HHB12733]|uniref:NAD-dependent protein deacylase n=1 Tax=Calocera cornea HHB12733 TaxID=1353952 RepID=A0A165DC80_9BASI|nr:DHS-like NAD/FAD-binding domain-containing protein [Calocera cornea HHB12733]